MSKTTVLPNQSKARAATAAVLPASVDLSQWAPTVGNQQDVGACASWAVAHLMGWYANKNKTDQSPISIDFAPMYIYSQLATSMTSGSTAQDALSVAIDQGVDTVADYGAGRDLDWQTKPTAAQKANASHYRLQGYTTMFSNAAGGGGTAVQTAIQTALAAGTPVAIAIPVRPGFDKLNATNSFDDDTTGPIRGGVGLSHEVLALGYDSTGLLIENQWGTEWGAKGYGRLSWNVVTKDLQEADVATGWGPSPTPILNLDSVTSTNPTTTSVTVSGTVQSLTQSSANLTFAYSTTTLDGYVNGPTTTVTQTVTGGPGTLAFSQTFSGLTARQAYLVSIQASNSNGSGQQFLYSFYTPGAPAIVQVLPEPPTQATSANIYGYAALFTDVGATFKYDYGTSTAYGQSVSVYEPLATGEFTFLKHQLTGLLPSTTYHYRLTITTAHGSTVGTDNTLTTPPLPTANVVEISPSSGGTNFLVTGTPGAGTAVSATVNWGTTSSYGTSLTKTGTVTVLSNGTSNYVVSVSSAATGLTPGATYHYSTTVTTDAGTVTTPDQTFIAAGPPTITSSTETSPSTGVANFLVQGGSAAASSANVTVNWGLSTSYGSSATKAVTASLTPSSGYMYGGIFSPGATGLTPGATYHYSFTVTTANGTVSSPDQTFIAAGPPTILSATETSPSTGVANFLVQGGSAAAASANVTVNWGLTTSYGSSVTKAVTASLTSSSGYMYGGIFSPGATGLVSGKTYHYSFTVTTGIGTVTSADQTFVAK